MNKTFILIMGIVAVLVASGCTQVEKECDTDTDCQARNCFTVQCKDGKCAYSSIADCCGNDKCESGETYEDCPDDCPNCDDKNECTIDEYDYHDLKCVNTAVLDTVCCGNGVCETAENYMSCSRDCPDCGVDNACKTNTRYDYHKQECVSDVLIPCCGNDICDEGDENTTSCLKDCPNCDDGNQLTTDIFNFATQECESTVTHLFFDDFEKGTGSWQFQGDSAWSTLKEGDNTVFRGTAGQRADLKDMELTNYILKLRVKVISDLLAIHVKRIGVDTSQGGEYSIYLSKHAVSLERSPDLPETVTASFDFEGDWHDLEARIYDETFNLLVDDEMLIKYRPTDLAVIPFPIGMSGVFSLKVGDDRDDSEFLVDDVEIKIIEEGDVIYP